MMKKREKEEVKVITFLDNSRHGNYENINFNSEYKNKNSTERKYFFRARTASLNGGLN